MTTILALLLGIALYLLMGMILAHHTKLGSKYYPASLIRLTFFWAVPVAGIAVWFVGMFIICFLSDFVLFGDKNGDEGLSSLVD